MSFECSLDQCGQCGSKIQGCTRIRKCDFMGLGWNRKRVGNVVHGHAHAARLILRILAKFFLLNPLQDDCNVKTR